MNLRFKALLTWAVFSSCTACMFGQAAGGTLAKDSQGNLIANGVKTGVTVATGQTLTLNGSVATAGTTVIPSASGLKMLNNANPAPTAGDVVYFQTTGSTSTFYSSLFSRDTMSASSASAWRSALGLTIGTNVLAPTGSGAGLTGITSGQVATTPAGNLAATTQAATNAEIDAEKAPLDSPTFTGTPAVNGNFYVNSSDGELTQIAVNSNRDVFLTGGDGQSVLQLGADGNASLTSTDSLTIDAPTVSISGLRNVSAALNGSIDLFANEQPARSVLPKTGVWYAFGTSQTTGGTTATSPYVSGGFLLAQYRYPNIAATSKGRNLTVENWAVGGSGIAYPGGQWSNLTTTHFNQWSRIPDGWTGVSSLMGGYNNLYANPPDGFFDVMERAYVAWIARGLISNYAGVGTTGLTRDGGLFSGAGSFSFTTSGTDDSTTMTGNSGNGVNPFLVRNAANTAKEFNGSRYRVDLDAGQHVAITLSRKKAAAIFFETDAAGGLFNVFLNDTLVHTGTNAHSPAGGNDTGAYPLAVWLDDLPATAVIRVEAAGNNVKYLATGWVESSDAARNKTMVLISEGNVLPSNTYNDLQRLARKCEIAVAAFGKWPVYYANGFGHIQEATDTWPTDSFHFNERGHQHLALAVTQAYRPVGASSSVVQLPAPGVARDFGRVGSGVASLGSPGAALGGNVEIYARDTSSVPGFINLVTNSANASADSGSLVLMTNTGAGYTRWARFFKDGTAVFQTGASNPTKDSSGAKVQIRESLSITPITSSLLKTSSTGLVQAASAGTDYLAPAGSGASLTALNASALASGTVDSARLPAATTSAAGAVQLAGDANAAAGTSDMLVPTVDDAARLATVAQGYQAGARNDVSILPSRDINPLLSRWIGETPNGLNFAKNVTVGERRNVWRYTEDYGHISYGGNNMTKGTDTVIVDGITLTKATFASPFYSNLQSNITGLGLTPFTTGEYYLFSFFAYSANDHEQWAGYARGAMGGAGNDTSNCFERKLVAPNKMRRLWTLGKATSTSTIDMGGLATSAYGTGGSNFVTWVSSQYPDGSAAAANSMVLYVGGFQIERVVADDRYGIAFIGDSTMQGSSGGNDTANSLEWPVMLGAHLNVHAFNRGVGGNQTSQMDTRWGTDITPIAARSKYVVIQPSAANDIPNGVSLATTQAAVNSMVTKALADSLIPVICVPPSTALINANAGYKTTYDQLCAWIRTTFPRVIDNAKVANDTWNPYQLRRVSGWEGDGTHFGAEAKRAIALSAATHPWWEFPRPSAYQPIPGTTYTAPTLTLGSNAVTLAGSLTTAGANALTLTTTGTTNVTLPTSGTLLTTTGSGASLTALNATQLTSGTVPAARLPAATGTTIGAILSTGTTPTGVISTKPMVWVFEGDSITAPTDPTGCWPYQLLNNYGLLASGVGANYHNVAVAGETAQTIATQYASQVQPYAPTGSQAGFYSLLAGTNDLAGRTAAQVYADLLTSWSAAAADGFRVIAWTVPVSTSWSSYGNATELKRKQLNELIRGGSANYHYLIDCDKIFGYPGITDRVSGVALQPDGTHPSNIGYGYMAAAAYHTVFGDLRAPGQLNTVNNPSIAASYVAGAPLSHFTSITEEPGFYTTRSGFYGEQISGYEGTVMAFNVGRIFGGNSVLLDAAKPGWRLSQNGGATGGSNFSLTYIPPGGTNTDETLRYRVSTSGVLTLGSGTAAAGAAGHGTLTLAGGSALTTSGANALTLTTTAATNVTLPTSGTLVTSASVATATTPLASYAAGTAYGMTVSDAAVDFGTTDPTVTFATAGTYLLQGRALLRYNGATYASNETATLHLRRTNNTPADITNATTTATLRVITTITDTVGVMPLPPVIYTATAGDVVTIYGSVSATPAAGSVDCTEASIVAVRLY